jgi:hypothetical protein
MRKSMLGFLALLAVLGAFLGACARPDVADSGTGRQRYMTAKADCTQRFRDSLVEQSDCRAKAANRYIRPFYKYGDLMTRAQEQRRVLAGKADRHEISRGTYEHQVAQSEAAISREEDRRNRMASRSSDDGPFSHFLDGVPGLFR